MNRLCLLALCVGLWDAALPVRAGEPLSIAPRQAYLLLNNGHVIEGTVTAAGDRYDVTREGVEVRVKRAEVAVVCDTLLECYRHRRQQIDPERAQDRLDLVEWCLKHNLTDQAEQELQTARGLDPKHPRIRLLEPRLALAKQGPAASEAGKPAEKPAPPEQLDSLVRNLPPGAMEQFTNTIQPMLLNYCSKSGCHARTTSAMRLERIPPNRLAGRHTTQHNLASVLAMVQRDNPAESKLLQAAIRAHGNMKLPVFTDREQSQYRQLVQWVFQVSSGRQTPQPTLEERTAPLLQNLARPGAASGADQKKLTRPQLNPADWSKDFPDQAADQAAAAEDGDQPVTTAGAPPASEAPPADAPPKDPFDPAIFNRRFFGR